MLLAKIQNDILEKFVDFKGKIKIAVEYYYLRRCLTCGGN